MKLFKTLSVFLLSALAVGLFAADSGLAHVGIETERLFIEKFENHAEYVEAIDNFLNKGKNTRHIPHKGGDGGELDPFCYQLLYQELYKVIHNIPQFIEFG